MSQSSHYFGRNLGYYATMPNSAFNSGRIAASLVVRHLPGDAQACLVPVGDWPMRAAIREMYRPYHDREFLQLDTITPARILETFDVRGPLSSLEFEDKSRYANDSSWYDLTRIKRALRAMWACGIVLTHHRKSGRHYYDRPERVIPSEHYSLPLLQDAETFHRWIIARRYQAVGLLRSTADAAIWSACGDGVTRKRALAQLIEDGTITPVTVGEKSWPYYMPTSALPILDAPLPEPRMLFLAPLDSIVWDRKGVLQLFNFDYIWEVYKPLEQRRWGYYVLPVFYGDRFVARQESRLEKGVWTIQQWWWEEDVTPNAELLDALRDAATRFVQYLRADSIRVEDGVDASVKQALVGKITSV